MSNFSENEGFETLDENEDESIEALLTLAEDIERDEERASITNYRTLKIMQFSYRALLGMLGKKDVSITYTLHKPYTSMGYISIMSRNDIKINNPKVFAVISKLASNIEAYKRTDGMIQINLTYHGLTTPLE
jgi:hypothetical protein